MQNTSPLIQKAIFYCQSSEITLHIKRCFGRIRNDQEGSKTLKPTRESTLLCGYPGIPGVFAMSRCLPALKAKRLIRFQYFRLPEYFMRGRSQPEGAKCNPKILILIFVLAKKFA